MSNFEGNIRDCFGSPFSILACEIYNYLVVTSHKNIYKFLGKDRAF